MERVFRMERSGRDGERLNDANLYLGDQADGDAFDGERLCVLEHEESYSVRRMCIPILTVPNGQGGLYASRQQLDKAANYITATLQNGQDLIVHCGQGVERSPLTVAWWFVKIGAFPTLEAAYGVLATVRHVIQDRRHWLEPIN